MTLVVNWWSLYMCHPRRFSSKKNMKCICYKSVLISTVYSSPDSSQAIEMLNAHFLSPELILWEPRLSSTHRMWLTRHCCPMTMHVDCFPSLFPSYFSSMSSCGCHICLLFWLICNFYFWIHYFCFVSSQISRLGQCCCPAWSHGICSLSHVTYGRSLVQFREQNDLVGFRGEKNNPHHGLGKNQYLYLNTWVVHQQIKMFCIKTKQSLYHVLWN